MIGMSSWIALGVAFCVVGHHVDSLFAAGIGWGLVLGLSFYVGLRVDALLAYARRGAPAQAFGRMRWIGIAFVALVVGANMAFLIDDVNRALADALSCAERADPRAAVPGKPADAAQLR